MTELPLTPLVQRWRERAKTDARYGVSRALGSQREYFGPVNAAFAIAECADELEAALAEARRPQQDKPLAIAVQGYGEIIAWLLGEKGEFPGKPDDWPRRPYYWRKELRERATAVIQKVGEAGAEARRPQVDYIASGKAEAAPRVIDPPLTDSEQAELIYLRQRVNEQAELLLVLAAESAQRTTE